MPLKLPTTFKFVCGLTDEDVSSVKQINECLLRLNEARAVEINASGPFLQSKLAWKLSSYQHALLHRLVSLMSGAASGWNSGEYLSTLLSARAAMETVSIIFHLETRVSALIIKENLSEINRIVDHGLFSSRDPKWVADHPQLMATNILTYISRFDEYCSGFKSHYDALSERCHPNSHGHNFMFSTLDRNTGTIVFDDEKDYHENSRLIIAALYAALLIEERNAHLTELVWKVADLQSRIDPVG